jgi:transcriptional regulator GlxA family with amidase domain
MINVTILAFDFVLPAALMGMHDLLYFAGRAQPDDQAQRFNVRIASCDGRPVSTNNHLTLTPHCALQDIAHSDLYLVPTIGGEFERTLTQNPQVTEALKAIGENNSIIGSNGTGALFLAEAGLLDNRIATTHWTAETLFRERYPQVDLRSDQPLTHDGSIICDAGGVFWWDLGLYLIELFYDQATAANTAKLLLVDMDRVGQLSFSPLTNTKYHSDKTVLAIQSWIEEHQREAVAIDMLGKKFGLSSRSLIRRFKLATGLTPLNYLQAARIESAKRLLVRSNKSIEEVTNWVGYEDVSSFIRLFKRNTGLTPSSYRARYKAIRPQDSSL